VIPVHSIPVLIEWFVILVLESLTVGRPVLALFSSSIPEVSEDAVTYFDQSWPKP
jgi:hypothetical protein